MSEPDSTSQRAAPEELEARLAALEKQGVAGALAGRMLRYLPLLTLGHLLFAVPATVISAAVAYFAFEQADATRKMQVASVWPRVTLVASNLTDEGRDDITLSLVNKGVGPAIVRGMRISYREKDYTDFRSLLAGCCAEDPAQLSIGVGTVNGEVISPGEEMMFAVLPRNEKNASAWERLNGELSRIAVATCYCSVFDECWIDDNQADDLRSVPQCPADWVQYTGFPQTGRAKP